MVPKQDHQLRDAGRESGIWQGANQMQLQDLESQWNTYKVDTQLHVASFNEKQPLAG